MKEWIKNNGKIMLAEALKYAGFVCLGALLFGILFQMQASRMEYGVFGLVGSGSPETIRTLWTKYEEYRIGRVMCLGGALGVIVSSLSLIRLGKQK